MYVLDICKDSFLSYLGLYPDILRISTYIVKINKYVASGVRQSRLLHGCNRLYTEHISSLSHSSIYIRMYIYLCIIWYMYVYSILIHMDRESHSVAKNTSPLFLSFSFAYFLCRGSLWHAPAPHPIHTAIEFTFSSITCVRKGLHIVHEKRAASASRRVIISDSEFSINILLWIKI